MRALSIWVSTLGVLWGAASARAEPSRGDLRFSLDVDVIGLYGTKLDVDMGAPTSEISTFAVGNAASPASLGFGWVLGPKSVLGSRLGFAFDKQDAGDFGGKSKLVTFLLAPYLTLMPVGDETKLFFELSPILRVGHAKLSAQETNAVAGGVGVTVGMLVFANSGASVDVGFFFDALWGDATFEVVGIERDLSARTMRGGVRLGLSIWE